MRTIARSALATLCAAGVLSAAAVTCAPTALATEDEEFYLEYVSLFGDFSESAEPDPQRLLDEGYAACEGQRTGMPEDFAVNFIASALDVGRADAQLVYDAATDFLC
ncbi:MAG: DUF732 domain-containing protein [Mycobacterium sp.]